MSYPPRPPIMPGIMVPPFHYPPMNMMPIGMMPVPGMMRPGMPMHGRPQMILPRPHTYGKPEVIAPPILNKQSAKKLPVTTVFVGNIHDKAPDVMVKSMLQKCGNVLSWKRVKGASGKLQAFGFCEYANPSSTLRCIRLLNDWNIVDKKLLVKVDPKTEELLEEYKKKRDEKRKKSKDKEDGENNSEDDDGEDSEKRKDQNVKVQLEIIIKEHEADLNRTSDDGTDDPDKKAAKGKTQEEMPPLNLEGMELEEDIKYLVNREIRSFRDTHLNSELLAREKDKDRDGRKKRNDKSKETPRGKQRDFVKERREREREREKERAKEKEREREKIKSPPVPKARSPLEVKRSQDKEVIDLDEDEEMYERKKLERKLREKEAAYQELLRKWESRERKKAREYERERQREKERRAEENKESKRLREFLEDYNDERDDVKYYKGSALQRRLHEREKELEADERDRRREREELEEIRKKLQEQGHPDLESEMARIELMREEHLMPQMSNYQSDSPVIILEQDNDVSQSTINITMDTELIDPSPVQADSSPVHADPSPKLLHGYPTSPPEIESPDSPVNDSMQGADDFKGSQLSTNNSNPGTMNFQLIKVDAKAPPKVSPDSNKRKLELSAVFNQDDEEEENSLAAKMRRFNPIGMNGFKADATERGSSSPTPITAEGKREWIKNFIEKIPATRKELFVWSVSWNMVDQELVNKRIKPWINKKIVEYIGEEEPTLTDFISTKILSHASPDTILSEVSMILDEESEEFVMKLWRLLIYEVEAKRRGINR